MMESFLGPEPAKADIDLYAVKECPKCTESGEIGDKFGVRKMKRTRKDGTGVVTVRPQSHCRTCRGKKKPKEKPE